MIILKKMHRRKHKKKKKKRKLAVLPFCGPEKFLIIVLYIYFFFFLGIHCHFPPNDFITLYSHIDILFFIPKKIPSQDEC